MKSNPGRIFALLLLLAISLSLPSCGEEPQTREVTYCELRFTLPREYEDFDSGDAFDAAYSHGGRVVGITRLSFDACVSEGVLTTMDARGFAEYYTELLGIGYPEIKELGDTVYYTYLSEDGEGGLTLHMPQFVVTPYSYMVVTYIASDDAREGAIDEFLRVAGTVRLSGSF